MRYQHLFLAALMPAAVFAETYLSENFANYIPSAFTIVNADGGSMQPHIYNRVGNDPSAAWMAGQLANGYGRAALSLTRKADASVPCDNRMILPPVTVSDADAVLQFEARSLHKHCPESYRVAVRRAGAGDWADLYVCEAESSDWTMHSLSLADYAGDEIEIAFIATTQHGFILAVDNVFVGVPDTDKVRFESRTPHYIGDDGAVTISGTLTYYGQSSPWSSAILECGDTYDTVALPELRCGDSVDIEFMLYPNGKGRYDYTIKAVGDNGNTVLYTDFISCSHYPRTHIIDRGSGTWCPQCPPMELTTSRLERLYGDQVIVLETHVNDKLTNADYWHDYLEERVYSVPCLIPNHDHSRNTASLKTSDDFSSKLHAETIAMTEAHAHYTADGDVRVSSNTVFAIDTDNSNDRYRMAYMLIGDIHDAANGNYMQSLSVSNFNGDQFYYMAENIMPEMMYFDNVPVNAEVAYNGVPASLPGYISAAQGMGHEYTLAMTAGVDCSNVRVVAMVIDTADGSVINAALAVIGDPTGITDMLTDAADGTAVYYDVCGRRVTSSASGIVIERRGSGVKKIIRN